MASGLEIALERAWHLLVAVHCTVISTGKQTVFPPIFGASKAQICVYGSVCSQGFVFVA